MPLTTTAAQVIANDATFIERVRVAFFFAAREVLIEAPGQDPNVTALRKDFARSLLVSDSDYFNRFATAVVTHPDIVAATPAAQNNVTDLQLITAVREMWNVLANVP